MNGTLDILELAIAISARNHNPTVLNSDFLKYSGIVPTDWELARPPVFTARAAQVVFKNGVNIVAQVGRVNFSEPLQGGGTSGAKIQAVAEKYVRTLPQADYQGIEINFRRLLALGEEDDAARNYIVEKLLAAGNWSSFGTTPVRATVSYVYNLPEGPLNLNVNEAKVNLQQAEGEERKAFSALVFTGVLRYSLNGETPEDRLDNLSQQIAAWPNSLERFQDVVNNGFLANANVDQVLLVRDA